jgi:PAS domain S-box-containing protein
MLKLEVERRRASERAMIESREKYRVLIRNIPLGIVITAADGAIVEINPTMQAWLGAASLESFIAIAGHTAVRTARDDARMTLLELIRSRQPVDARRHEHASVRWNAVDGSALWFDVVGVRVPVSGLGAAVVFADRTGQHRARDRELAQQQQLAHATRLSLMGQFASALAHELGQPLNACQSYAAGLGHRLARELRERPDAREALERIQLHLAQAGDVIRNVRTFIAQHRPEDEPIDLRALVHATLELLQLQLREAAVQVTVSMPEALPMLRGSRVELQQVLVNLLLNAVEALRGSGAAERRITVRVTLPRRHRIAVAVADNGPGVPPALRDDIFRPYTTTKPEGLGMGLMMCRTIVESHGGELRLDPRRRRGATFRFTLPVTDASADAAAGDGR